MKKISRDAVKKANGSSISVEDFVVQAIKNLREPPYKGIHSVWSKFNAAFRLQFPGLDPVAETQKLSEKGIIAIGPAKGGVMLYLPEDAPDFIKKAWQLAKKGSSPEESALQRILGKK